MFEAITHTIPKVQGGEISSGTVVPMRAPAGAETQNHPHSVPLDRVTTKEEVEDEKPQEDSPKITQKLLSELEQDIEAIHSIGLQFSMHNETGRTMIKIMDKTTEKLIREIPSEDVLNLAAKIEEMIGILFDKKA